MVRRLRTGFWVVTCALATAPLGLRPRALPAAQGAQQSSGIVAGSLLLSDDFESYPIGVFPSAGGWFVVHRGAGGTIDNGEHYSGTKSWRFDDGPIVQRNYRMPDPPPPVITFECRVKIRRRAGAPFGGQLDFSIWAGEYGGLGGSQGFASLGFVTEPTQGGLPWPSFCPGCKEYFAFHNWRYLGPAVSFGRWYQMKARIDLSADTGSAWLGDQKIFSNVPLASTASFHFAPSIGLEPGRWGPTSVVWVDDVRVYTEVNPRGSDPRFP